LLRAVPWTSPRNEIYDRSGQWEPEKDARRESAVPIVTSARATDSAMAAEQNDIGRIDFGNGI
jgi:hypothetical protein